MQLEQRRISLIARLRHHFVVARFIYGYHESKYQKKLQRNPLVIVYVHGLLAALVNMDGMLFVDTAEFQRYRRRYGADNVRYSHFMFHVRTESLYFIVVRTGSSRISAELQIWNGSTNQQHETQSR